MEFFNRIGHQQTVERVGQFARLISTNTGAKYAGQFSPDLQSFIAGNAQPTVVETIFTPNAPNSRRYARQRCMRAGFSQQ
jgi:hypothetical protein